MMEFAEAVEKLRIALGKELPGKLAHARMAPIHRSLEVPKGTSLKKSAVLLAIYKKNNKPYIVFMRRPVYNGPHSGQISFPGGKCEKVDVDLKATALREANEELGIRSENVEIIGQLSPLVIPHSQFVVYPFVAVSEIIGDFVADSEEVEEVLEYPLEYLLRDDVRNECYFNSRTGRVLAPYFDLDGQKLWGATSMILNELLMLL